ncbi:MAG: caspase family protein, partial [Flavobacteriia bacterium]
MKIKVTFICLFCAFTLRIVAQNKHALVVAIGDYPTYKDPTLNWSDLSSLNDVELLKELFIRQSFKKENVTYLINDKAYTENLQKAFDSITQTLSKGDVFYFHFSGHGQQVADLKPSDFPRIKYLKRDELDGMDETLVLYHAPLKNYGGYNFEGHFYDDQMNHYLTKIQEKLGPSGQVIVVIDACHSGTATRGAEEIVVRGSNV